MKKFISYFLIGGMLLSSVPVIAAIETNYTVYNLNFDGGDISAVTAGDASISCVEGGKGGGKAVFADGLTADSQMPYIGLKYLGRQSYSEISVSVKPVTEESTAKAKLIVVLNENGTETEYTLDEKNVSKGSWVMLSNTLHTKYKAIMDMPKVKVVVTDSNGICSYMLDDFLVTSDTPSTDNYQEVPEINDNGNYYYRAAFETNTIDSFKYDAYTNIIPEYYCTDEIPPHSGKQSLFVTGRGAVDSTITVLMPGVDQKSKIEISCWVRNAPGVMQETYQIVDWFRVDGKLRCHSMGKVTADGDEWVLLTATVDLSQFNLTETPGFQIRTANDKLASFYVDDIVVTSDMPGKSYDDMNFTEPERDDNISDTAYRYVPKNIPVQQDIPSLKDVYKDYFKIGVAIQEKSIGAKNNRYHELIAKHCNQLTGEGSMKGAGIIKNSPDGKVFDWANGNKLADYAYRNGFELVGHVITWEQTTYTVMTTDINGKFLSRDEILAFMKEAITKIMTHFEGDGDASEYAGYTDYKNWHCPVWDVANEAAYGTTADGFSNRGSGFRSIVGQDWVRYAFQYADETGYDDIELRYNDFGEQNEDKLNGIYTVVKHIIDGGCRLDIIGLQSHYNPETTISSVRRAFEKLGSFGTKLDVTELDMKAYTDAQVQARKKLYENGIPRELEFTHANLWLDLFELYKEYSDRIDRVTMWSITDKLSSVNESSGFDRTDYGNIFDRNMQAKPQYWAIADPEYYLKEILKDDTSKLRFEFNGNLNIIENETDTFEENGAIYVETGELLSTLTDIKYVINGDRISVIRNGVYYEINAENNVISADFKDYKFEKPVIRRDGKVFVSYADMLGMMGYGSNYGEQRNLVTIAEYQQGDILDEINF